MEKISAGKEAYIYKDFSSEYGRLMDYYVLQDGSAYFLYEKALTQETAASSAGYEHYILKYTKESDSYETLNFDIPNCYMENILVSPQGHLALAGADTTYLYRLNASASQDAGPEAFARIRADSRLGFLFTSDGGIVCMPVPGESYISYDLDTGNKNGVFLDKKYLYSGASDLYPYLQQAGDTILLVTGKGIYEKKANGWILQVSSEANSMSRSDFYAQGVWKGTQEDFYIKTGSTLYHYVKDDNIQKPEISLKLQSCVDYPLMKDIIAGYRTARYDRHASLMPDELWRLDAHQEGSLSAGPFSGSSYFLLFQGATMNGFSYTLNDYFIPELMLGIHSKTEWKEEAEDFIRYAFAYAHENASKLTSIPVFRDGLVPRMQNSLNRIHEKYRTTENHYIVTYGAENEARTLYAPTKEDYATCYEPLVNGLKAIGQEPSLTDPVYLIYASSAISFLNGDITIDLAVDEIRSRLSLLEN